MAYTFLVAYVAIKTNSMQGIYQRNLGTQVDQLEEKKYSLTQNQNYSVKRNKKKPLTCGTRYEETGKSEAGEKMMMWCVYSYTYDYVSVIGVIFKIIFRVKIYVNNIFFIF